MVKPKGYDEISPTGSRYKKYLVYIDGILYGETSAVSPEKAANNIRWQMYEEFSGWWDVPSIDSFDCVEI